MSFKLIVREEETTAFKQGLSHFSKYPLSHSSPSSIVPSPQYPLIVVSIFHKEMCGRRGTYHHLHSFEHPLPYSPFLSPSSHYVLSVLYSDSYQIFQPTSSPSSTIPLPQTGTHWQVDEHPEPSFPFSKGPKSQVSHGGWTIPDDVELVLLDR
jgi:hypothetical protein